MEMLRAASETLDAVFLCFLGAVAATHGTIGIAMLWRSRRQPHATVWRRQRLGAPRWAASIHLFLALTFANFALGDVLFEAGSNGDGLMILATLASAAGAVVACVMWFTRRAQPPRHPSGP